jgi:hypothetical protein
MPGPYASLLERLAAQLNAGQISAEEVHLILNYPSRTLSDEENIQLRSILPDASNLTSNGRSDSYEYVDNSAGSTAEHEIRFAAGLGRVGGLGLASERDMQRDFEGPYFSLRNQLEDFPQLRAFANQSVSKPTLLRPTTGRNPSRPMLLIADDNNRDVISASKNIDLAMMSDTQNKLAAKLGSLNYRLNLAMRAGNHLGTTSEEKLPPGIRQLRSDIQKVQDEISQIDVQRRQMYGNSNEVRQSYASDPKPKTLESKPKPILPEAPSAPDQTEGEAEEQEEEEEPDHETVDDEEFNALFGDSSYLQDAMPSAGTAAVIGALGALAYMHPGAQHPTASAGQPGETVAATGPAGAFNALGPLIAQAQEGAAAAVEAGQQAVARVVDSTYQAYQTTVGEAQHITGRILGSYQEAKAMAPVHVNTLLQGTDWSVTRSELTQSLASRTGGPDGSTRTDTIATSATVPDNAALPFSDQRMNNQEEIKQLGNNAFDTRGNQLNQADYEFNINEGPQWRPGQGNLNNPGLLTFGEQGGVEGGDNLNPFAIAQGPQTWQSTPQMAPSGFAINAVMGLAALGGNTVNSGASNTSSLGGFISHGGYNFPAVGKIGLGMQAGRGELGGMGMQKGRGGKRKKAGSVKQIMDPRNLDQKIQVYQAERKKQVQHDQEDMQRQGAKKRKTSQAKANQGGGGHGRGRGRGRGRGQRGGRGYSASVSMG